MIEGAEPGGVQMTPSEISRAELKADLCQLANSYSFPKGARFVDKLLAEYNVSRKHGVKKGP